MRRPLRSLAARAYGITFAVLVAGIASYAALQVRQEARGYRELVEASAGTMARAVTSSLARDLVLDNYAGLDDLLSQIIPLPGVLRLQVCEPGGQVLSDVRKVGRQAEPAVRPDPARLEPPSGTALVTEVLDGGDTLVIWQPIASGHPLGWLRATLDQRPLQASVHAAATRAVLLSLLFIVLCLALLVVALRGPVRAIGDLAAFARQLDRRKGETVPLAGGTEETTQLAEAINYASGELARSEQRLREERERLAVTLASLGEAVFATDLSGRLQLLNRAAEQLTGVPAAAALGRPLGELFRSPEGEAGAGPRLQALAAQPGAADGGVASLRVAGPEGGVRTVEAVAAPLLGEGGETLGAVVVVRDLTERERLAAERHSLEAQLLQSQKMEALGHLAGGVAHDFNNILTAIVGYAHLAISEVAADSPAREDLAQILTASERATGLTRALLAFGRKQAFEPRTVDLNAVAADLEKILRRLVSEDVELRLELGPGPLVAVADAGQLGQILINLVANARDAMPRGGQVTVSSGTDEAPSAAAWAGRAPPPAAVWLEVADTGSGMDELTMRRVFEPFFTTKPKGKGTGLGLAIVHGIVTQHGGAVSLRSEVGVGTRVRVLLPRSAAPLDVAAGQEPHAAARGEGTILLVEDEGQVGEVVRRTLEAAGYRVLLAADGRQGLDSLRAHRGRVDLVVSDVIMPEMNGAELSAEVRRLYPSLPILLVSGYTADVLARGGPGLEGVEVVHNPLQPQRLLRRVDELVRGRRPGVAAGEAQERPRSGT